MQRELSRLTASWVVSESQVASAREVLQVRWGAFQEFWPVLELVAWLVQQGALLEV